MCRCRPVIPHSPGWCSRASSDRPNGCRPAAGRRTDAAGRPQCRWPLPADRVREARWSSAICSSRSRRVGRPSWRQHRAPISARRPATGLPGRARCQRSDSEPYGRPSSIRAHSASGRAAPPLHPVSTGIRHLHRAIVRLNSPHPPSGMVIRVSPIRAKPENSGRGRTRRSAAPRPTARARPEPQNRGERPEPGEPPVAPHSRRQSPHGCAIHWLRSP
jgi:hypothetical protein